MVIVGGVLLGRARFLEDAVLVFGETGRGGGVEGRVAHVLVFGETGCGGGVGGRVAHVLVFGETGRGGGVGGRVAQVLVVGETGRGGGVGGRVGGRGWGRVGTGERGSRQINWRVRDVIHLVLRWLLLSYPILPHPTTSYTGFHSHPSLPHLSHPHRQVGWGRLGYLWDLKMDPRTSY